MLFSLLAQAGGAGPTAGNDSLLVSCGRVTTVASNDIIYQLYQIVQLVWGQERLAT